jgi:ribosome-associated toxin RatA of RatAB toxin-antitoxin module
VLGYVAALVVVVAGIGQGDEGWERIADRDGITVERRNVEGSRMRELRASAHSPVPPTALMATLWKHDEYVRFLPYLKRLDVLGDGGDVKLIYEQFRVPFAKDRDATLRVTRKYSPDLETYDVSSLAVSDAGPPESDDHVRVRTSLARWRLAPASEGGTAVTYTIRTDAGGRLPAWIADAMQKSATVKVLRAMLDRARQSAGR